MMNINLYFHVIVMSEVKTKQEKCIHHWIIDAADGSTSYGRCKHCGLVKTFSNDWQNPYLKSDSQDDIDSSPFDN